MTVTVRVTDDATGEEETQHVRDGDYLLIVTDPAELTHTQVYGCAIVLIGTICASAFVVARSRV